MGAGDAPRSTEETAETVHPFPGVDAYPDKRGELCFAGTGIPVDRLLRFLADHTEQPDFQHLDLNGDEVRLFFRGLADWLKTQNWTGAALARNRYDDGPGDVTPEDCAKLEGICAEKPEQDPVCPNPACGEVCARTDIVDGTLRCPHCGCGSPFPRPVARIKASKNFHGFRCLKCGNVFPMDGNVKDGVVMCPDCKTAWVVEKRCGTCDFGSDYTCNFLRVHVRTSPTVGSDDGGFLTDDNGPPWPDCRFWKPKE